MKQSIGEMRILLVRLGIALIAYPICKILFLLLNYSHFADVSVGQLTSALFWGLRFDLSALVVINAPFIILHIIPFFTTKAWHRLMLKILFIIPNSIAILADCLDMAYFKFTLKRTTADFFDLFGLGSDISTLLPQYIRDFWYIVAIWIILVTGMVYLFNRTWKIGRMEDWKKTATHSSTLPPFHFAPRLLSWTIINAAFLGLCVVAFRGGLQLRPIMPINASEYVSAKNIPLIINTPFSIIKSSDLEKLEPKEYFKEDELTAVFDPVNRKHPTIPIFIDSIEGANVFIIILESFSAEYIGALSGQKTHTPFLDSLIGQSLVFDNAFANGKKSLEGLPAVVAGIPGLINEPFITSIYGANRFNSLPLALKEKGYSSAFFHGGINGTMGFDAFAHAAGYDHYYGKTEYNNENDYDGNWGIWDEEFFQYTEQTVTTMKEPFIATIFSLSSHHPSAIPEKYKERFEGGELPILKSVEYADFSLRKFFASASKEKWFDNTLFVITADHTGPSNSSYYSSSTGIFRVPILFYKHNSLFKGVNHRVTQQIDIMPTVLNRLNYAEPYFAFGQNMLDTNEGYAVNFISDVFQLIQGEYLLQFDGNSTISFYNYKTDSLLQENILGTIPEKEKQMENKLKAIIQTYYNGLIHNKLSAERK